MLFTIGYHLVPIICVIFLILGVKNGKIKGNKAMFYSLSAFIIIYELGSMIAELIKV